MSGENRRAVAVGDPLNLRLESLVSAQRNSSLEGLAVGRSVELVPFQVLRLGVPAENLGQNLLLHGVGVAGHLLDELELLSVLLTGR